MYQASQADSCTLMMCAPCLLDLIFTLPRATANAPVISTFRAIVIDRPAHAAGEYIASSKFETPPWARACAARPATFRTWRLSRMYVQKIGHNGGWSIPQTKEAVLPCSPG
jgi:hypothetical protein